MKFPWLLNDAKLILSPTLRATRRRATTRTLTIPNVRLFVCRQWNIWLLLCWRRRDLTDGSAAPRRRWRFEAAAGRYRCFTLLTCVLVVCLRVRRCARCGSSVAATAPRSARRAATPRCGWWPRATPSCPSSSAAPSTSSPPPGTTAVGCSSRWKQTTHKQA